MLWTLLLDGIKRIDWEEPCLFFFNGTYEMEMNVVLDKVHSLHTYLHRRSCQVCGKGKGLLAERRAFMYGIIRSCNQSRKWFFVQHAIAIFGIGFVWLR